MTVDSFLHGKIKTQTPDGESQGVEHDLLNALSHWRDNSETKRGKLPLPPIFYTSDEIHALEVARIFKREWICTGHVSELPKPGDYITFDIVGHPVLVIRDHEGKIHAHSNVCPHRSGRLVDGKGSTRVLICPYHAWTFELNGKLHGAPYMKPEQLEGVCLNELRLEIWQGLVFVNLDQNAAPLAPRLEPLLHHIAGFDFTQRSTTFTTDGELNCNWKVFVENFCESYHVFKVHRATLETDTPTVSVRVLPGGPGYNHHTMNVVTSDHPGVDLDNLCCIYPCMTISIGRLGTIWLSIRPINSKRLQYRAWLARKISGEVTEQAAIREEIEHVLAFMAEDNVIMENVQTGLNSGVGNRGPLNEMEKTNWEFGHYYAGKLLD